jgi:hypothetical protein
MGNQAGSPICSSANRPRRRSGADCPARADARAGARECRRALQRAANVRAEHHLKRLPIVDGDSTSSGCFSGNARFSNWSRINDCVVSAAVETTTAAETLRHGEYAYTSSGEFFGTWILMKLNGLLIVP